jgi:hypothetical protein
MQKDFQSKKKNPRVGVRTRLNRHTLHNSYSRAACQKKLVFRCLDLKIDGVFNGGGCPRPRSGEVSRRDFRESGDAAAGVTDAGLRCPSTVSVPERKCSVIIKLGRSALFEAFCSDSDSALLCISVGKDGSLWCTTAVFPYARRRSVRVADYLQFCNSFSRFKNFIVFRLGPIPDPPVVLATPRPAAGLDLASTRRPGGVKPALNLSDFR